MALGAAQYSSMNRNATTSSSTGHLAMPQIVTAVEPAPITSPTLRASGPVTTTAITDADSSTRVVMVTPIRIGIVFQIGRPSGMS